MFAAETQGCDTVLILMKGYDVFRSSPLKIWHELEAVVAYKSGKGAYPDVPHLVLVDALCEHLGQAVLRGVAAERVSRSNGYTYMRCA